jgi:ketosteroid isomerase-like protein
MKAAPGDPVTDATLAIVQRFNEAFSRRDVDGIMALMSEEVVFENTLPPPDGERHEGQAAVRTAWEELFRAAPQATFETEEIFAAGDRCVVRWLYRWAADAPDRPGHVRGVDLFRVRDGKVAEKLAYVKG